MKQSRLIIILRRIWPTVYRIINAAFFAIIVFIKGFVTIAIKQIRGQ